MLTIILFAIIGCIMMIIEGDFYDLIDYFIFPVGGILFGVVVGFLFAVALPMKTYDKKYDLELVSLQDNSSLNGSFFIGSGHIGEKMGYVFYHKTEDNSFKLAQFESDMVSIKYTSGKPIAHITDNQPTETFWNLFGLDLDLGVYKVVIEVPEGSIKNEYKLDAQ